MECPDGDQDAPHPVEFADCKNAHADEDEHGHAGDDAVFGAACHALPAHVGFKIVFVQARADVRCRGQNRTLPIAEKEMPAALEQ